MLAIFQIHLYIYICICTLIIDLHYNCDNILLLNTADCKSELNKKDMSYSFVVTSRLLCNSEKISFSLIIDKGRGSHPSHFVSCLCVHTACKLTSFGSGKAYQYYQTNVAPSAAMM